MAFENPNYINQIGEENLDTQILPEFTFKHAHVNIVLNAGYDLESYGISVDNPPSDLSQCILITPSLCNQLVRKGNSFLKQEKMQGIL